MAIQVVRKLLAELDAHILDIGDIGVVIDGGGVPTGQIRLGVGDQAGGFTISGVVGGGAVSTVNGQTGVVSLALDDISNVSAAAPSTNDILKWNGSAWESSAFVGSISGATDIVLSNLSDGQSIRWHALSGKWVNYTPTSGGGTSDNLGNHTATQSLRMQSNEINGALALRFSNSWRIYDTAVNSIVFEKSTNGTPTPIWTLLSTGTAGQGFLALTDYGSTRPDDSTSVTLDNIAYFQNNGVLRRARRTVSTPNAFKAIPADAFGNLSFAGATVGQALIWNGSSFVPQTIQGGGSGATTFLALTDTPTTFVGSALRSVRVNAGATALEFFVPTFTVAGLTEVAAALPHVANEVIYWNGSAFTVGPQRILTSVDIQSGTPTAGQGIAWNAVFQRFDFIDCLITDFSPATPDIGSLMYFDGTAWVLIAPGTNGDVLTMVGGVPAWA